MHEEVLFPAGLDVLTSVDALELLDVPHPPSLLDHLLQLDCCQLVGVHLAEEVQVVPDAFGALVQVDAALGCLDDFADPQVCIDIDDDVLGEFHAG